MSVRALSRLLVVYAVLLCASAVGLFHHVRLRPQPVGSLWIASVWRHGVRVARAFGSGPVGDVLREEAEQPGALRVVTHVLGEGPMFSFDRLALAVSLGPGRQGILLRYAGRTAYATPDDLQKLEAYGAVVPLARVRVELGLNVERVLEHFARELHATPDELLRHGSWTRFSARDDAGYPSQLEPRDVDARVLRDAVLESARFLTRNQHRDGAFRYEVAAVSGADLPGRSWPRHAAAAYFLARAGRELGERALLRAARTAARYMQRNASRRCGAELCIGDGDEVDLGSAAMALLAYSELIQAGYGEFADDARSLAGFAKSLQRPDGGFRHVYSLREGRALDVELEFYTGEAALALARYQRLSGSKADLEAAARALRYLVTPNPLFVTARYFWGAEHWTCQALEELWDRAPDARALAFCVDWHRYTRTLTMGPPDAPAEYDGGLRRGPFLVPRLTPQAARLEAELATLAVLRVSGADATASAALERQVRRAAAFLLRFQFRPGPIELMPDPAAVYGGFPSSPTELRVRIDNSQHAGGALLRYLGLLRAARR